MVAAVPGDCANRLVDAQETTIGRNFGNTDGRMFVSRGEPLFLLEREQARPFEGSGCPLALRNVEKAVNGADDFPSCVAQRIDVDGDNQAGAVGMLHDTLDISYRRAAIQNLGNHRARDGCSIELEETNALPEFFVGLARRRRTAPNRHGMTIILEDRTLRIADEGRDRQQLENTVGCAQHRAQDRGNGPRDRMAAFVGINHSHASAWTLIPLSPASTISLDGDLSMARSTVATRRCRYFFT